MSADTRCVGCAEAFCFNCLVDIKGQKYCGSCKVMALEGRKPGYQLATKLCSEARDALILAIVGSFCCFGIVFAVAAIVKAETAKKTIAANPQIA